MRRIKQEHLLGCGIACVAHLTNLSYHEALTLFVCGEEKVKTRGFYCHEIVEALRKKGLLYQHYYFTKKMSSHLDDEGAIIFIKKSKYYPGGHFLSRKAGVWHDSWINFPELPVKAGFRNAPPGDISYILLPL